MQRKHVNMIRSHGHDRPRCNQGTFDGGVQSEPTTRPRTAEMGAKELELQPIRAVLPACNAR